MSGIRVAVLFAVVVAAAGLAAPGVGADVVGGPDDGDEEPPMGSHVSAFMQSSTVAVNETVESEMFDAAFESADADRREQLVANRTAALERKIQRLTEEYERLQARDDLPAAAYDGRAARLASRITSLERAINDTEPRADEVDLDADLGHLRENASSLAGPEVAETARKVVGVDLPRGPPDEAGPDPPSAPDDVGAPDTGADGSGQSGVGSTTNGTAADETDANDTPANDTPASETPADDAPGGPPGGADSPNAGPPAKTPAGDERAG